MAHLGLTLPEKKNDRPGVKLLIPTLCVRQHLMTAKLPDSAKVSRSTGPVLVLVTRQLETSIEQKPWIPCLMKARRTLFTTCSVNLASKT